MAPGGTVHTSAASAAHPVVQVLSARREAASTPGRRPDDFKVGLAVEGGGMRGVLSGAMLAALADCGLTECFDAVYAYSSGGINSAYFLAGGDWQSLSVYYDDLISREFFDPRRALSGGPVVSLDFVLDVVMEKRSPLDYEKLIGSPVRLHLIASSIDQVRPHSFTGLTTKADLRTALKASACIPVVAGPPVVFRGERFVDGAVLLSHPFLAARADGCTHVLVIRTRSGSSSAGRWTLDKRVMARRLERLQPGMREGVFAAVGEYAGVAREISRRSAEGSGGPFVLDVGCPDGSHGVGRLTQDRAVIYQGMRVAYGAMLAAVTGRTGAILLRPVPREG
jgi:predicted patatin/cPLA2 family phospholipase